MTAGMNMRSPLTHSSVKVVKSWKTIKDPVNDPKVKKQMKKFNKTHKNSKLTLFSKKNGEF